MQIGYRSDDNIKVVAQEFLLKYHPDDTLPVPIEDIIEFDISLNIFPMPDLKRNYGIDGALSQDFSLIYVDKYCYDNWPNRYRFTLAHEIGHYILHKSDLEDGLPEINSVEDWVVSAKKIASVGSWFETEASSFASYVLMPSHHLESEFNRILPEIELMIQVAIDNKLTRQYYLEGAIDAMASRLSRIFQVSEEAVKVRISKQKLGDKIP